MATTALTFTKQPSGKYLAEASVTKDFALHVETSALSDIVIYQKSDSKATKADANEVFSGRNVLDVQCHVLLPATIYVESSEPVTYGSVTD